jgi:dCMP deaminase
MIYATNLIPGSIKKTPERCDRPLKYQYLEHAERTAIFRAGAHGINTTDSTLYCPWYACVDCARAIISAGVNECVGVKQLRDATPERWLETVRLAESMLIEAGVKCTYIEDKIGQCEMVQDGKLV